MVSFARTPTCSEYRMLATHHSNDDMYFAFARDHELYPFYPIPF
jgi:hypothetical protein